MTRIALLAVFCWMQAAAADIAVLRSGARIRAVKIERDGDRLILYTASGRIEIDSSDVASLEHEDDPAPPAPAPPPAAPAPAPDPKLLVTKAALRYGLPPAIVHALAATESAYKVDAVSPKGAIGVMQLMPSTARELNVDPNDAGQNIDAGTRLLRELLIRYQNDPNPVRRALAAYNAGAGAVDRYKGVPPYRETQDYVEKVIEKYWRQADPPAAGKNR